MTAQRFDVMIIGGGILGLATGYKYLLSHPGKSLALLEREPGPCASPNWSELGSITFGHLLRTWFFEGRFGGEWP